MVAQSQGVPPSWGAAQGTFVLLVGVEGAQLGGLGEGKGSAVSGSRHRACLSYQLQLPPRQSDCSTGHT